MKVYLAARFSRREEVRRYSIQLQSLGHTCECRWLTDPTHRIEVDHLAGNSLQFNTELAFHDLHDLDASDTVVFFSPGGSRGGCHVEFGFALARTKRLIWVGERQHVFSYLPQVEWFPSWEEARASVFAWLAAERTDDHSRRQDGQTDANQN